MSSEPGGRAYRAAGVDIDRANELVARYARSARRAGRPEVALGVGGFAGLFRWPGPDGPGFLAAGADGVGTKVALARQVARLHPREADEIYRGLGRDLVAMCVNDLACLGASPLFVLDYLAWGRLDPEAAALVVEGAADACLASGAALLGGETAEMPGTYADDGFDVAGAAVGWAPEAAALRMARGPEPGDVALGLAATGPHSNGFSLIRKILNDRADSPEEAARLLDAPLEAGRDGAEPLWRALLRPTALYAQAVAALALRVRLRGAAHITGGGLVDNPPRPLRPGLAVEIREGSWPEPAIFAWLAREGRLSRAELRRTFNLGLGMVLYVDPQDLETARAALREAGVASYPVGQVVARGASDAPQVIFR